jgi:hypothetical protein
VRCVLGMTPHCHPDPGREPGEGSPRCERLRFLAVGSE